MARIVELALLCQKLDSTRSFADRMQYLLGWLESLPGVDAAKVICADRLHLGPAQAITAVPHSAVEQLPLEPAILNGNSPLPPGLFAPGTESALTVSLPFVNRADDVAGAFLIKSGRPDRFLRRNDALLRVISSKVSDLVEIAGLRNGGQWGDGDITAQLMPRVIGTLMDLLRLPMFMRAPDGSFIAVNREFRSTFNYPSLDELNAGDSVITYDYDWDIRQENSGRENGVAPLRATVRTGDDRLRAVEGYTTRIASDTLGVLIDVTEYVEANAQLQENLTYQQSINRKLSSAASVLRKTQATAMKSLAKLAEYRDKETGGHLQRICEYMRLVTAQIQEHQPYSFQVASGYPHDIYLSGMLHDIGKVGVPDQILLKPGPLDETEWTVMKRHTEWGHSILTQADHELGEQSFLTLASRIARNHHEWWDGSGYPDGLRGEAIPLSARVGAVADVYDALTSRRPYKEAWTHDQAVEEIRGLSARQFDPVIVDIFTRLEDQFRDVRTQFPDGPSLVN